jgi:NAD(P)-dependent dehydrogenase (short-subunit alcohol dehydrogenase family)
MSNRLTGKTAVITGAAGGIGRSVVEAFLREGAAVVATDLATSDITPLGLAWREQGHRVWTVPADLADDGEVEHLVREAVRLAGPLTSLVNVAGVDLNGTVLDTSSDDWMRVLNVNLTGMARTARYALPHLLRTDGASITFVSSIQGLVGFPNWAAYAAAKGGIHALTRQMCVEYGPQGLRVNAIAPGAIRTPMLDRLMESVADPAHFEEAVAAMAPTRMIGRPADIAWAAVYLASDEAAYVSGHVLVVDGGSVAMGQPLDV